MQAYKTYLLYFLIVSNTVSLIFLTRHLFDDSNKKESPTNSALFDDSNKKEYVPNSARFDDSNEKGSLINPPRKVSIALLHPASSPTIDSIIQGFKEELAKEERLECSYTPYNNQSDNNRLNAHAEEIITQKNFDLILTVGHSTSIKTAEVARKKGCRTPIVFTAVIKPVEAGVVPKNRDHTCFITGSSSEAFGHYERGLELLLLLKSDIKRLLIPYNPSADPMFHHTITDIEQKAFSRSIPVQKIKISSVGECVQKINTFIQRGDVIVASRDPIVMAATADIAQLAFRYDALVYSFSSGAIEEGAAFGFSTDDKVSGINAGKKVREILADGKHPADVPITSASYNPYLWVNEKALKSPTLKMDPLVLFLIENVKVGARGNAQP